MVSGMFANGLGTAEDEETMGSGDGVGDGLLLTGDPDGASDGCGEERSGVLEPPPFPSGTPSFPTFFETPPVVSEMLCWTDAAVILPDSLFASSNSALDTPLDSCPDKTTVSS